MEEGAIPKLSAAVGKDTATVRRWIKTGRIPYGYDRKAIALQCGCSVMEAEELALDELPEAKGKAS